MIEQWLADVIVLSVMFGIVFLVLITCKGHDLCHREKNGYIFYVYIFEFFWFILSI